MSFAQPAKVPGWDINNEISCSLPFLWSQRARKLKFKLNPSQITLILQTMSVSLKLVSARISAFKVDNFESLNAYRSNLISRIR